MDNEILYLKYHDLQKAHEALDVRVNVLENFIREQFPGFFAGEVGTVTDPDLKPIELHLGPLVPSLIKETEDTSDRFDGYD